MIRFRRTAAIVAAQSALAIALNGCEARQGVAGGGPVARNGCLSCHAADREGPNAPRFSSISKRYAGIDGAAGTLLDSLRDGSHGKWTQLPGAVMPPQPQLSEEERKALVEWILRQ